LDEVITRMIGGKRTMTGGLLGRYWLFTGGE